jgi:hypothetical protein
VVATFIGLLDGGLADVDGADERPLDLTLQRA